MKLRQKIILLAIGPLVVALCVIALFVRQQAVSLAQQQRATIESAYLASKEGELRNYLELGSQAIARLTQSGRQDSATLDEAKRILATLNFGDDGYFFIYDMQGNNLMHPRQPDLVGRNLWEMRDGAGRPTIQHLIARAREGGGMERYTWIKPSTNKPAPKLGYVVPIPQWGWMMGTGIYLDDVEAALAKIDVQQSRHIQNTLQGIAELAIVAAIVVGIFGIVLNVRESRLADAKLRVLAQRVVNSQEEERARLSRDLHDGISQALVSIKFQIEAATVRFHGDAAQRAHAQAAIEGTAVALTDVLGEVRRISQDLRPALLDDLGLPAALGHLAHGAGLPIDFRAVGVTESLPINVATVLYRIAQEALSNTVRHARASRSRMALTQNGRWLTLTVIDNGVGFDPQHIARQPRRGIGLRNMSERVDAIGGELKIVSNMHGTILRARVKLERLK